MVSSVSNRLTSIPKTTKNYVALTQGLITEATELTFPPNCTLDEDNCVLFRKGSRRRRLGIDYETDYSLSVDTFDDADLDTMAVTTERWENVGGDPDLTFLVVQIGATLYFYDLGSEPVSDNKKSFSVDLSDYAAPGVTDPENAVISVASGRGSLFVTSEKIDPFFITYDSDLDSITETDIFLEIRDFEGVEDNLDIAEKPSTLTAEHEYNLKNQGWAFTPQGLGTDVITHYKNTRSVYPSNAQIWFVGKNSDSQFSPDQLDRTDFGNTRAPRGHFILDPFYKDRSAVSGVAGLDVESEVKRPTAITFFAGRVFYAGTKGNVYFSQVVNDNLSNVGYCYQEADPTSEDQSDLVATDGGVIKILDAGDFIDFFALGDSLVIFARNGVWQIGGSEGTGFKATDFSVSKSTNVGALSKRSIVNTDGLPVWWSETGIFTLEANPVSQKLGGTNLTERTIKTYYFDIPAVSKLNCTGVYDKGSKRITWFYKSTEGGVNKYRYDKVLVLDTDLGAFYPWTISFTEGDSPFIADVFETDILNTVETTEDVVVGTDPVLVSADEVEVTNTAISGGLTYVKYFVIVPDGVDSSFTFGQFNNDNFIDWAATGNGVSYLSFLESGHEVFEDIIRYKQAIYLYCYFKRTETGFEADGDGGYQLVNPSSCMMQAKWDWADHDNSNKFTTPVQVYRFRQQYGPDADLDFDNGFPVVVSRNKLRGRGRSLRLRFESEEGKDFELLGYAINGTGNTEP